MSLRMRWLVLSAVLGLSSVSTLSCSKDSAKEEAKKDKEKGDDDDDKGSGKKKKKKGDDDDKAGVTEKAKYESGDVLKYVPKSCDGGYGYVNLGALVKNEALASNMEAIEEKLADAMKSAKDGKKASKALKVLKSKGLDITRDPREIAVCTKGKNDVVVLVGGTFSGKDVLAAISSANEAAGDGDMEVAKSEGVSYVKLKKKGILAQVAPNVLAIGDDQDSVLGLKSKPGGGTGWDVSKGRIFTMHIVDKKEQDIDASLTEKGDDLEMKFAMELQGKAASGVKGDPEAFKKIMRTKIDEVADKLEKSPLKKLADPLRKTKIEVDGAKVTFTAAFPSADLASAIKAAAEADESELKKILK